jgi:hypothetical protein
MLKSLRFHVPLTVAMGMIGCSLSGGDDDSSTGGTPGTGTGTGMTINVGTGPGTTGIADQNGGTRTLTPEQVTGIRGAACTGWSTEGEQLPAILELVVDVSGSMDDPAPGSRSSKWQVTHDALGTAINGLAPSTGIGVLYYPNGPTPASNTPRGVDTCINIAALVPTSLLGTTGSPQRQAIQASLDRAQPANFTPTHDAFHFALEYGLKPFQSGAPKFMLLITDGAPTMSFGCVRPNQGVVDMPTDPIVAEIAGAMTSGIKTFVIGSPGSQMSSESSTDMRPWLSRAATAGGTATPGCNNAGPNFCHMDMTQAPDFAAALSAGLKSVASQIASCVYTVPPPPAGQTINPAAINLIVHSQGGDTLVLPDGQGACSEGWSFDASGNIVLCPATCDAVKADTTARVELLFGCAAGGVPGIR